MLYPLSYGTVELVFTRLRGEHKGRRSQEICGHPGRLRCLAPCPRYLLHFGLSKHASYQPALQDLGSA